MQALAEGADGGLGSGGVFDRVRRRGREPRKREQERKGYMREIEIKGEIFGGRLEVFGRWGCGGQGDWGRLG